MKILHILCLFPVTLSLFFTGCTPVRVKAGQVEKIVFTVSPKGIEHSNGIHSFFALKCDMSRDTTITDRAFIKEFVRLVNRQTPSKRQYSSDLRAGALLYLKNGASLCVCFGESFGCVIGDVLMEDDPEIFAFINQHVRAPHPNDYWFDDRTREFMRYARELLDLEGGTPEATD